MAWTVGTASPTASANGHDSRELPNLLHGNETRLYGDSAHIGQKDVLKDIAPKAIDFTNKRAAQNCPLTDADKETNLRKSQARAKAEHPFRPLKSIYGFAKARYRGLVKNANRAFALLALTNREQSVPRKQDRGKSPRNAPISGNENRMWAMSP